MYGDLLESDNHYWSMICAALVTAFVEADQASYLCPAEAWRYEWKVEAIYG